jgi:hypothetical protein
VLNVVLHRLNIADHVVESDAMEEPLASFATMIDEAERL